MCVFVCVCVCDNVTTVRVRVRALTVLHSQWQRDGVEFVSVGAHGGNQQLGLVHAVGVWPTELANDGHRENQSNG